MRILGLEIQQPVEVAWILPSLQGTNVPEGANLPDEDVEVLAQEVQLNGVLTLREVGQGDNPIVVTPGVAHTEEPAGARVGG